MHSDSQCSTVISARVAWCSAHMLLVTHKLDAFFIMRLGSFQANVFRAGDPHCCRGIGPHSAAPWCRRFLYSYNNRTSPFADARAWWTGATATACASGCCHSLVSVSASRAPSLIAPAACTHSRRPANDAFCFALAFASPRLWQALCLNATFQTASNSIICDAVVLNSLGVHSVCLEYCGHACGCFSVYTLSVSEVPHCCLHFWLAGSQTEEPLPASRFQMRLK